MSYFDDNESRIVNGPHGGARGGGKTLSVTMQAALKDAIENGGGYLKRFPGGFWRAHEAAPNYHGKQTIDALRDRGLVEVTGRQSTRGGGSFIVEVKVKS